MTHDNWKATNPDINSRPCRAERTGYEHRVIKYGRCEACGSDDGNCWWEQQKPACWFCEDIEGLSPRERSYDSAPLGGWVCRQCREEELNYRKWSAYSEEELNLVPRCRYRDHDILVVSERASNRPSCLTRAIHHALSLVPAGLGPKPRSRCHRPSIQKKANGAIDADAAITAVADMAS
jgi:hypothetical protein